MQINSWQETVICFVAVLSLMIVPACSPRGEAVNSTFSVMVTSVITSQPANTVVSTLTSQPSQSAALSQTAQATLILESSPSPATTSTPTATVTLPAEALEQILAEAMQPREDCRLPCWWGIVPGETSLGEARQILHEVGATALSDRYFAVPGSGWGMDIEFEVDYNDMIQSIDIASPYVPAADDEVAYHDTWNRYSVAEIVQQYGLPSQVVTFIPFQGDFGGGQAYILVLFYEESGAVIEYTGYAQPFGERYQVCPEPNDFWNIHLLLYPPRSVESMVREMFPPDQLDYLWSGITYDDITWEGITGTDLEAFHELITSNEPDEACYEIPHIVDIK